MMSHSTRQPTTAQPFTGNLFLLVLDRTGAPMGLVPMRVLETLLPVSAPPDIVDAEAKQLSARCLLPAMPNGSTEDRLRPHVESALRRLYDFMYLGQHPLAELQIVNARSARTEPATLTRGKAVSALLLDVIEQLRPPAPVPARLSTPPREWHPYLILYQAYIEGRHNTAIMSWLQTSEGTFNRTRRRAVQTVTHALVELEQAQQA